ncbi:hypothetical protein H0H87_009425 [Tephrocybe sp. NHM501043]|nr:hypothetical protein H0H87_009425 [Tephrocybe sp. NHM501043]
MKYSTAVAIACIGGATLVAAENPSVHHPAPPHNAPAPPHHSPAPHSPEATLHSNAAVDPHTAPKPSRSASLAKAFGKFTKAAGTFTKHASGNGYTNAYSNDPYATDTYSSTGIYRRFKLPHVSIPHIQLPHITPSKPSQPKTPGAKTAAIKNAGRKSKELARTAIAAGGGSAAVAENLGNVAFYLKSKSQQTSTTGLSAADAYSTDPYAQESVYRRDETKPARRGRRGSGKQRLPPQTDSGAGEDKHISAVLPSRDLMDDDELLARDGWWGYVKSNHLNHEEDHATHSAKAPVVTRESDEGELEARSLYLDENLFGRSFGEDKEISARYLIEEDFALRGLEDYLDSRDDIEEFEFLQRRAEEELEFEGRSFSDDKVDLRDFNIDELD